jgi:hypothetical protein
VKAGERADHPIELLSASLDRELRPAEASALEAHLEGCAGCRDLMVDFRRLDRVMAEEAPPPVPVDLGKRILAGVAARAPVLLVPFWKQAMPLAAAASLVMAVLLWYGRPDVPPLRSDPAVSRPGESPRMESLPQPSPPPPPPAGSPAAPAPAEPVVRPEASSPRRTASNGTARKIEASESKTEATGHWNADASGPASLLQAQVSAGHADAVEEDGALDSPADGDGLRGGSPGGGTPQEAAPPAEKELRRQAAAREKSSAPAPGFAGAAPPVAMMAASAAPRPFGLLAAPYTVRLEADHRMRVDTGPWSCTATIDDVDGRRIAAAVEEGQRLAAGAAADPAPASPEAVIVAATPQTREWILRLVRERYRRALEARCGPLPD